MNPRSPRRSVGLACAPVIAVAVLCAACSPGPTTPGTADGCRDDLSSAMAPDVSYTGEPAEIGNLRFRSSTDGSCSGALVDVGDLRSTLIVTDDRSDADFLCAAFFGADAFATSMDRVSGPWDPPFGPDAHTCRRSTD